MHHATIARAFRWRKLLEIGDYGIIEELATAEKINASYVSRILRLTLLAPHIVESILDGRQRPDPDPGKNCGAVSPRMG
jgi:hypothetical protein